MKTKTNITAAFVITSLIMLSSCANNISKSTNKKETGKLQETGFFEGEVDLEQPSLDIKASGNATISVGDSAIMTRLKTTTKKSIKTDSAWDMTLATAYEKYSTMTYIYLGLGLCLIVIAIKRFEKTSVGRVFSTSLRMVDKQLQHADPKSDDYRAMQKIRDGIEEKKESFFKRG